MTSDVIGWESFEFKGKSFIRRHTPLGIKIRPAPKPNPKKPDPKFIRGDRVRKIKDSSWQGIVCGEYSTALTPEGYVIEFDSSPGIVFNCAAALLEKVDG